MDKRQLYIVMIIIELVILFLVTVTGSAVLTAKKKSLMKADTSVMISESVDALLK